jgi:hypothetical protein
MCKCLDVWGAGEEQKWKCHAGIIQMNARDHKLNQIGIDKKFFHAAVLAGIQKVDEGHRKHRLDVIPSSFLTYLFSRSQMVEALDEKLHNILTHTHTLLQSFLILKNGLNG